MTPKQKKPSGTDKAAARRSSSALEVFDHDDSITRALAIVAHPDDVDFGMAGTIATLTSQGIAVTYCLVTSGDAGGDDMVMAKEERAKIREDEQRAAPEASHSRSDHWREWSHGAGTASRRPHIPAAHHHRRNRRARQSRARP